MRNIVFAAVIFASLSATHAAAADPPADPADVDVRNDDIGVGWKIGIGCAIATIALSGLVGAVTKDPIDHDVRKVNPQLAAALSPPVVVGTTASVGFIAGIAIATVAAAENPTVR